MGVQGMAMQEGGYRLNLFDLAEAVRLAQNACNCFHLLEAVELLRLKILDEIEKANGGCPLAESRCYTKEDFQKDFDKAVFLVAEGLADYYRHGAMAFHGRSQRNTGQSERHSRDVVVADEDLRLLLTETREALPPESELRKSWEENGYFEEWQAYVKAFCQTLE